MDISLRAFRARCRPFLLVGLAAALIGSGSLALAPTANATATNKSAAKSAAAGRLKPLTHFTMNPDGSSGRRADGALIPNIDSVKKTIATYYGDPGTGIADKTSSPYITQVNRIIARQRHVLQTKYYAAIKRGEKPALVFDTDDTMLATYDMEVGVMRFNYSPTIQD